MAVVARQRKSGLVYYVATYFQGQMHWERSGKEEREAYRLEKRRENEVKEGRYVPPTSSASTTRKYFETWLPSRKVKTRDSDIGTFNLHVFTVDWFCRIRLDDVRPRHVQRLIVEIQEAGLLAPKSVANLFGVLRVGFRAAHRKDLIPSDPCLLDPGTISTLGKKRQAYTKQEAARLIEETGYQRRQVWNALAFYTGMRMGEVCGRRWRDWDRNAKPLGCLKVATQYFDQPLKTDEANLERPRQVPVHPELERILDSWWHQGFELTYLRKPTEDDFIVPTQRGTAAGRRPMTKTGARYNWLASCKGSGVKDKTEHAVRHTFLTLARRGGARKDVIERVTHNASGDIVDQYTHWEWDPLCEAVLCFPGLRSGPVLDADLDASLEPLDLEPIMAPTPGLEPGNGSENETDPGKGTRLDTFRNDGESAGEPETAADLAARQAMMASRERIVAMTARADARAGAVPLAICSGLRLAFRMRHYPNDAVELQKVLALAAQDAGFGPYPEVH